MRVGFDARWYNDSGVGTHVAELVRAIAATPRNFDLIVYENPSNRLPGLTGDRVERVAITAGRYSPWGQLMCARRCRQDRLDVFHSPFFVIPLLASCPVVVTLHDVIPFLFPIYSWPKRLMVKAGYHLAARRSRAIISVSHQTALDVHRILHVPSGNITVVHNAVSRSDFSPEEQAGELRKTEETYGLRSPYVVAASARNWKTKNLVGALNAIEYAAQKLGTSLFVAVYGPKDGLEAARKEKEWKHLQIKETAYLPAADLAILFRHASCFVMPSLYEGFGLPILEAMSCGCPVITSNAGSLSEVAGTGAQTFSPDDTCAIGGAIFKLAASPEERLRWRERGLARANEFSWERAARETIDVYWQTFRHSIPAAEGGF